VAWSAVFLREQKNAGYLKAMMGYSDGLNDLVSKMLHLDPMERPTADELMGFPFVRETVRNVRKQLTDRQLTLDND
jgi:serine/threonine protein kinase